MSRRTGAGRPNPAPEGARLEHVLRVGMQQSRANASRRGRAITGPSSSSSSAVPVIDIPASDLRIALQIRESGIVPGQPGLYSVSDIPANSLVSCYTYDLAVTDDMLKAMSKNCMKAVNRYAVAGPEDLTFILKLPVDGQIHPAAMSNEPRDRENANMQLHGERVFQADGSGYFIYGLYTCNSQVEAGTELTWNYSGEYQEIRDEEGYSAGHACESMGPVLPPLSELVTRVLKARGERGVEGVLYSVVHEEEMSSEHDSDSDYKEGRCVGPVQPRRQRSRRCAPSPTRPSI